MRWYQNYKRRLGVERVKPWSLFSSRNTASLGWSVWQAVILLHRTCVCSSAGIIMKPESPVRRLPLVSDSLHLLGNAHLDTHTHYILGDPCMEGGCCVRLALIRGTPWNKAFRRLRFSFHLCATRLCEVAMVIMGWYKARMDHWAMLAVYLRCCKWLGILHLERNPTGRDSGLECDRHWLHTGSFEVPAVIPSPTQPCEPAEKTCVGSHASLIPINFRIFSVCADRHVSDDWLALCIFGYICSSGMTRDLPRRDMCRVACNMAMFLSICILHSFQSWLGHQHSCVNYPWSRCTLDWLCANVPSVFVMNYSCSRFNQGCLLNTFYLNNLIILKTLLVLV